MANVTFKNISFRYGSNQILKDFSLEIVESRMKAYEDSGDTATPRGNFKVLYPDGVLVSFNGRGTAQEIWDMFCSMGP